MTTRNVQNIFILLSILWGFVSCESPNKTNWELLSPNGMIKVSINNTPKDSVSTLSYRIEQMQGDSLIAVLGESPLGILRNDDSFYKNLKFLNEEKQISIEDAYTLKTGKTLYVESKYNEMVLQFKNGNEQPIDIVFRTYDDGVAFRYKFPNKDSITYTITKELSGFAVPQQKTWMQAYDSVRKYGPAYEKIFKNGDDLKNQDTAPFGWCFPALMKTNNSWVLLTEADLEPSYFGAHLTQQDENGVFNITMPLEVEAMGLGKSQASSTLRWATPWRTIILGESLGTIIESNMVTNLSKPNVLKDTDWIKPGRASWSWWSSVEDERELDTLIHFVDFAVKMKWEYSLVDAAWHDMAEGEMDSLVNYANSKNIGLLLWYNSGGAHNVIEHGPRDLMDNPERRKAEFKRIHKLGIKGIKVDFLQSDKPFIIHQYIDILKDAAKEELLVNFHGCTVPRGWRRTYPNLVSMESVMGAESYRYSKAFSEKSPALHTIYAATRNVIGPMDYTPVTFSKSNFSHLTSYAHELALCIVFESGITHFADKISTYENAPGYVQDFLKTVPVTWDEIKYLDGIPGKDMILARRKGDIWYVGGINGENNIKKFTINISDLGTGYYELTQIVDGKINTEFALKTGKYTSKDSVTIATLPYGGFVMVFKKNNE
jgi:hypothetical protein